MNTKLLRILAGCQFFMRTGAIGALCIASLIDVRAAELHGIAVSRTPIKMPDGVASVVAVGVKPYSMFWNKVTFDEMKVPIPPGSTGELNAVAMIAGTPWAVGDFRWVTCPSNAVCTGVRPYAVRWQGAKWVVAPVPAMALSDLSPSLTENLLYGVSGSGVSDAWAVGVVAGSGYAQAPTIFHWDGTSWSAVPHPPDQSSAGWASLLSAVASISVNDAWAVGWHQNPPGANATLVYHWDGNSWSLVQALDPGTVSNTLAGVAGSSAHDVWAVGSTADQADRRNTLAEHWNGSAWEVSHTPNILTGPHATMTSMALP
jgi:hypothetical protein